eukprot:4201626-Alexandrium_andersonii.AAC.1
MLRFGAARLEPHLPPDRLPAPRAHRVPRALRARAVGRAPLGHLRSPLHWATLRRRPLPPDIAGGWL